MKSSRRYALYGLITTLLALVCLAWAWHISSDAFPLTNGFKEMCYETGYFHSLSTEDPICNSTRGLSFLDLTLVSLPFIAIMSLMGSVLGIERGRNLIASLVATAAWLAIINIITYLWQIPVVYIAPYSGNTYVGHSYIPFMPNGSIILEAPLYLAIFFVADWIGRKLKNNFLSKNKN